jgi:hypothetical protein
VEGERERRGEGGKGEREKEARGVLAELVRGRIHDFRDRRFCLTKSTPISQARMQ